MLLTVSFCVLRNPQSRRFKILQMMQYTDLGPGAIWNTCVVCVLHCVWWCSQRVWDLQSRLSQVVGAEGTQGGKWNMCSCFFAPVTRFFTHADSFRTPGNLFWAAQSTFHGHVTPFWRFREWPKTPKLGLWPTRGPGDKAFAVNVAWLRALMHGKAWWMVSGPLTTAHIFEFPSENLRWTMPKAGCNANVRIVNDSSLNDVRIYVSGWWFGTFFIFPYIWNNHPNWLSYFSEG
jgi:hypothetical protein